MPKAEDSRGPKYYTRNPNNPVPEKSAASYLNLPYDAAFESFYESSHGQTGYTLPFSDYIGPGNSLNQGPPRSESDENAKVHDIEYAYASYLLANNKISKNEFYNQIGAADADLVEKAPWYTPLGIHTQTGISLKAVGESIFGQLYPGSEPEKSTFETQTDDFDFVPLGKRCQNE